MLAGDGRVLSRTPIDTEYWVVSFLITVLL